MNCRSLSRDENGYHYDERLKRAFKATAQFHLDARERLVKCPTGLNKRTKQKSLDVLIEPV